MQAGSPETKLIRAWANRQAPVTEAWPTSTHHEFSAPSQETPARFSAAKLRLPGTPQLCWPLRGHLKVKENNRCQHIALQTEGVQTDPAPNPIAKQGAPGQISTLPSNPSPKSDQPADAVLPAADLKPLYNFALDSKACQAKLAASQSDLTDEKTKTAALAKERDAAVRVAKGGSVLRRIARAAKAAR